MSSSPQREALRASRDYGTPCSTSTAPSRERLRSGKQVLQHGATSSRSSNASPIKPSSWVSSATTSPTNFSSGSATTRSASRSEEHTSELQSLAYLVCRLLLEKKKKKKTK